MVNHYILQARKQNINFIFFHFDKARAKLNLKALEKELMVNRKLNVILINHKLINKESTVKPEFHQKYSPIFPVPALQIMAVRSTYSL